MKVLIVDDDPDALYLLESVLKPAGFEVCTAEHGKQALDCLAEQNIDLIVSDILMPVMDGYQLLQICKQHERYRQIPFVIYSSIYTKDDDKVFAEKLGAARFLVKPQDQVELLIVVAGLMNEARGAGAVGTQPATCADDVYLREYNQRLVQKLEKTTSELDQTNRHLEQVLSDVRRLSAALLHSREDERNKMTYLLHEDLGQLLAVLSIHANRMIQQCGDKDFLASASTAMQIEELSKLLTGNLRSGLNNLKSGYYEQFGLKLSLQELCHSWQQVAHIAINLSVQDREDQWPEALKASAFHLIKDAMTNTVRHAKASEIRLSVGEVNGSLHINIEDNGCGFDEGAITPGLGLVAMRERTLAAHGCFTLRSSPGKGTTITIQLPLEPVPEEGRDHDAACPEAASPDAIGGIQ